MVIVSRNIVETIEMDMEDLQNTRSVEEMAVCRQLLKGGGTAWR